MDEDESSEIAPSEQLEDDGADLGSEGFSLTFQVAFDLIGRNPKHSDAHESIRLHVIRWARRDGLGAEADDIASEVMLKLAVPGELAKARGRATFKGFVYGYYRNEKRAAIRDRNERRMLKDIEVLERRHREDATSSNEDGAPIQHGGVERTGIENDDLEFDDIEGLSPTLAAAVEALAVAYPRGLIAVRLRCAGAGYGDIAAEFRTSEANARKIHSRAICFLREYLGGTVR